MRHKSEYASDKINPSLNEILLCMVISFGFNFQKIGIRLAEATKTHHTCGIHSTRHTSVYASGSAFAVILHSELHRVRLALILFQLAPRAPYSRPSRAIWL